jgi:hypothetical protein
MPLCAGYPTRWCPRVKTLIAFSPDGTERRIYPIRCKCWTCPFCFAKNLKKIYAKILSNPPERFITLTCKRHGMETPIECYKRHRPAIRKLFHQARKLYGQCEYVAFCEPHKNGFPHWHILQKGAYIPQHWLSKQWLKLTGSYIVDVRKCHSGKDGIRYAAKYVTKSLIYKRLDPRFRIATFSRGYLFKEQTKCLPAGWQTWRELTHPLTAAADYSSGNAVVWTEDHFAIHPYGSPGWHEACRREAAQLPRGRQLAPL